MIDFFMFMFFIIMYYFMIHETILPLEKIEYEIAKTDSEIVNVEKQLQKLRLEWGKLYNKKYELQEEKNKILYPECYEEQSVSSDTNETDSDSD